MGKSNYNLFMFLNATFHKISLPLQKLSRNLNKLQWENHMKQTANQMNLSMEIGKKLERYWKETYRNLSMEEIGKKAASLLVVAASLLVVVVTAKLELGICRWKKLERKLLPTLEQSIEIGICRWSMEIGKKLTGRRQLLPTLEQSIEEDSFPRSNSRLKKKSVVGRWSLTRWSMAEESLESVARTVD